MAPLPPHDQRHLWLRYQVEGYTEEIVHDFKERLETIFDRRLFGIRVPLVRKFILEFLSTYRMSDTEMGLDVADTLCFQLGGGRHLRRHAEGRKSKARLLGGHFIGHLATHFGLVSDEGLRGLQVVTRELPLIDLHEHGRLNICLRFDDIWAWVASRLERQHTATVGAHKADEASLTVDEGAQDISAPV
nr:hypothetical protein [Tanacetum cinerariifolium]